MGLDVRAYRGLTLAPDAAVDDDGDPVEWKNYIRLRKETLDGTEEHWPGRTIPLVAGIYTAAEHLDLPCGPYSRYNRWREWLCEAAGHGAPSDIWDGRVTVGPFVELINFSDCEGIIGPVVCAKLAKDFAEHQEHIIGGAQGYEAEMYRRWRRAFELAADGGCVDFH